MTDGGGAEGTNGGKEGEDTGWNGCCCCGAGPAGVEADGTSERMDNSFKIWRLSDVRCEVGGNGMKVAGPDGTDEELAAAAFPAFKTSSGIVSSSSSSSMGAQSTLNSAAMDFK